MTDIVGRVMEIRRFPVKSMAGELLSSVAVDALGIAGDRRIAVRDLETGKVVSAKQPKHAALLGCTAQLDHDELVVTMPDGRRFGADQRSELDAALSSLLGRPVRLDAATGDDGVYESYWPEIEGVVLSDVTLDLPVAMATGKGTFVDLAALHVVANSSLERLQALAPESTISVDRFRPGILVDGGSTDTFVENDWADRTATIGSAVIAFSTVAPRCVMTTVAQGDLPRDLGVLQSLVAHNRVNADGIGAFGCLGVYAEVTVPGTISVGDDVVLD